jgi:hypothetical protein
MAVFGLIELTSQKQGGFTVNDRGKGSEHHVWEMDDSIYYLPTPGQLPFPLLF